MIPYPNNAAFSVQICTVQKDATNLLTSVILTYTVVAMHQCGLHLAARTDDLYRPSSEPFRFTCVFSAHSSQVSRFRFRRFGCCCSSFAVPMKGMLILHGFCCHSMGCNNMRLFPFPSATATHANMYKLVITEVSVVV